MIFHAYLVLTALQGAPAGLLADPAYQAAKTLVGQWEGLVGKNVMVRFTFHIDRTTGMFIGEGLINAGSPNALPVRSTLGWDEAAKQVYYLDQHGSATVYFGHVTKEGNALLWDFRGLVGDPGHYRSRQTITPNEYSSDMAVEENGKWINSGVHLRLHRVK